MSIKVALTHRTTYAYDKEITVNPQVVRLRPAPHARTPVPNYTLEITPKDHFINWQQDAFANWQARLVFPEKTRKFEVKISLIADMIAINPFDFFLEEYAQEVPFDYPRALKEELTPYLGKPEKSDLYKTFLKGAPVQEGKTNDWIVALNQYVQQRIDYTVRMEPGVQTPDETIDKALGSCRDSGWLLVNMLRSFGYAARFVSGYLIQLTADEKPVGDGPGGPVADFTDLHAWAEVYLPGAGWVGLDPTSGLFAGEGHIPLAATPAPSSAAPIAGSHEPAEVDFDFEMSVERIEEPTRVTKPVSDAQWAAINRAGRLVDEKLVAGDVRLTMGGEPTFISATDRDGDEWNTGAVGPTKRHYGDTLIRRLRERFAPGGMLHYGQGKWYPGEQLPRWAFALYWRGDGDPVWRNPELIAEETTGGADFSHATRFTETLCRNLGLDDEFATELYEDPAAFMFREQNLPPGVDPVDNDLEDPQERARLARVFERGLGSPVAYVLPIQLAQSRAEGRLFRWQSDHWQTRRGKVFLMPGDSPAGLRLPLGAIGSVGVTPQFQRDPMNRTRGLPRRQGRGHVMSGEEAASEDWLESHTTFLTANAAVRTAMTVEPRDGRLCVFLPPTGSVEEYLDLVSAVEEAAEDTAVPIHVEGYEPPFDPRLNVIKVTPDPGVLEINIHPARSWDNQVAITEALYEEARQAGLDSVTYLIDGRQVGSGGGNHIVLGGETPADSPFLRRPDLLGSIIRYWQNHPSLSYLFSGLFIGPTSQAPRLDEARHDALYEMELALQQLPEKGEQAPPWLVDRVLRHLLTDLAGNTHRAEICIDKLFSPDGSTGRLGLVEFRGFEMPPHARMSVAQSLIIRGLIAMFWDKPYEAPLKPFGTTLHDRYLLPEFAWADFQQVLDDLSKAHGIVFDPNWFEAQRDFRFPPLGRVEVAGRMISLRAAIEPWIVLGEEGSSSGTARYVDSSVERIEVALDGVPDPRYTLTCNGVAVPLQAVSADRQVAGVRFRAWQPWSALHPTIPAHGPLSFDLYDHKAGRSIGGCVYHVVHPGGRADETRPINALEAEGRRLARFEENTVNPSTEPPQYFGVHPDFPCTLDLRRVTLRR
ncbi:MAG: transglutaminase family protein [Pseudomonadota bacterium]